MSENPYFLATNASIFDRNPFKEYTTNKLNDVLHGKSQAELLHLKEEALKFQERLEKGYINRLEQKEQLSPRSVQRRKFELERWVSSERAKLKVAQLQSDGESSRPLNIYDLDQARREAAQIIAQANLKAKEIKAKLAQHSVIHIQDQQHPFSEEESSSRLDVSQEAMREEARNEAPKMPELVNEASQRSASENPREEMPTVVLEISFEDEEEFNHLEQARSEEASRAVPDAQSVEALTDEIFQEFLKEETDMFVERARKVRESQASAQDQGNEEEKNIMA